MKKHMRLKTKKYLRRLRPSLNSDILKQFEIWKLFSLTEKNKLCTFPGHCSFTALCGADNSERTGK